MRIGRELLWFFLFLALATALTWPLATHLATNVSDTGDPLLNAWIIDWDCYALTHRGASLFQPPIFYPGKYPLAYSENMFGVAVVMLPFYLAGASAITTYNLAMLLGFAFSGYGAFVLGRKATGSSIAGLVAGVLYGFTPFRFDHLAHVQFSWGGWMPLIFAALLHYRERPSRWSAALVGGALVMNGACNVHYFLFGSFAYGLSVLLMMLVERRDRRFWIQLGVATIAAVVILYPLLRPYRIVSQLYNMKRSLGEVSESSAVWMDWLVASDRSALYGALPAGKFGHAERHLFPGLVPILLTLAALLFYRRGEMEGRASAHPVRAEARTYILHALDALAIILVIFAYIGAVTDRWSFHLFGREIILTTASKPAMYLLIVVLIRLALSGLGDWIAGSRYPLALWIALLCISVGLLGSFGTNGFFHTFLFEKVSVFRSIRAVARWAVLVYLGLSLASAYGVVALTERLSRRRKELACAALLVLSINDMRTNIVWDHALVDTPEVTAWLKKVDVPGSQPVIELPIESGSAQFYYLLWHTMHHRLVMNGTSGFEPPVHWRLHELSSADVITNEFGDILTKQRCALVIVHAHFLAEKGPKYRDWLKRELQSGRLAFVRRFDHGDEGDWVFAIPAAFPGWQKLRAPEVPDAAGFTPTQNLQRMLGSQATYNNITFGVVDIAGGNADGRMEVMGWALSPFSVRDVIARFESGARPFHVKRAPRGDVTGRWPWYPDPEAGFQIIFEHRPRGVRRATDMQIEIVDGRGVHTFLPSRWVQWP